jgi:signal transduction histidine kinase
LTDLRPPLLDELGLIAALDNEIRQRQLNHDYIEFHLDCESVASDTRWPSEVEYSVFMIAREAINNALLHAAPGLVQLVVSGDVGNLALSVQDDGPGIGKLEDAQRRGHLGMIGMHERATAIGAKLSIAAVQGAGTRVSLVWSQAV